MDSTLRTVTVTDETETRKELKRLAGILDSHFQLPWGWRIGWDGIIGLIPGIGDAATNLVSFYILYRGAMIGCPPSVVLRMALNVLIDNLIDTIPIIGNIFDFMYKSNTKNVALMEAYLNQPHRTLTTSRAVVAGTVLFIFAVMMGCMFLTFLLARWLWGVFQPLW
ncbi:MAG: DUF4112 domain-containing protein [Pseudobdellovibrionaceae bacterium]